MADILDVLTLPEAKTALGLNSAATTYDTVLAQYVTAVSRQLDKLCGPVVVRTVTNEPHDGGGHTIRLRRVPVLTVTTVTEYNGTTATVITAETNAAKTSTNYLHDGTLGTINSGTIIRRSSDGDETFESGRRNIEVTYEAGRAATTATVDARFKNAAAMMLRNVWTAEQATGSQTFGEYAEQPVNPLYGPGMLNKVAAMLIGELHDGVYVG